MIAEPTPAPDSHRAPDPAPEESIGPLLSAARAAAGRSQLRIAELLCAASGNPTLTRHEVSRWEREERIPGGYWLPWLALVLEVPLDLLERAAARARGRRNPADPTGATSAGVTTADPALGGVIPDPGAGWAADPAQQPAAERIAALRRADDLVGGVDLAPFVLRELAGLDRTRRPDLVAEAAQLAGWVLVDAGDRRRALVAHRLGLRAAAAARDDALTGRLLTAAAHLDLVGGSPRRAFRLALAGYARARHRTTPGARCLLLHRVAVAAARAAEAGECARALAAADLAYDRRRPADEPRWAAWLDQATLSALAGRCFLLLGQHRTAEPLLAAALAGALPARARGLCTGWLAACCLGSGQLERAYTLAGEALLDAVRLGSVRTLRQVRSVAAELAVRRPATDIRLHLRLHHDLAALLPDRPVCPGNRGGTGGRGANVVRCG